METKKNATAALVVAIIGLILSLLFALGGLVLSIIGIVLAAKAKAQQWSKANAALVISIIGLVLAVLNMVVGAILAAALQKQRDKIIITEKRSSCVRQLLLTKH